MAAERAIEALPMSRQQIRAIVESEGRINVLDGAVRSGKTVTKLIRWLMYCADEAPDTGDLVMIGKTRETVGRNLFAPLQDSSIFGELAHQVQYTQGAPLGYIFGRPVYVLGANDAKAEGKIRGMTVAGAAVDEATLLPKEFWNQLVNRMSVAGSKLFATTNPDNPAHWLRKDWILSGSPDIRRWHFTMDDNPGLPPDFVAFLKAQYVGLYYRRFILGEWVAAEGAVFDMWDPEVHVIDILPAIQKWLTVSIDYGTSNPFHALLIGLGADGVLYVAAEWRYDGRKSKRQKTDGEYQEALVGWLKDPGVRGHSNISPVWYVVDPSAASFRAELKRAGVPQVGGDNSVIDGIRTVSTMLARGKLKIHRSCQGLLEEIGGYSWDDDKALLGEDAPIKVDDHGVDALRYGVKTTERLWRPFVDLSAPKAA